MTARLATCRYLDKSLHRRLAPFKNGDWSSSALVVAPHPDDETLGCGGVVSKKIAAGVEVRFVFVTDGAASHAGRVTPESMRRTRSAEAIEAIRELGAGPEHAAFLDIPDGRAREYVQEIARGVAAALRLCSPDSVYVVHGGDPPSDHRAVHAAVTEAIRTFGRPITVYEYPVWYWYHWPWVAFRGDLPGLGRMKLAQTARTAVGLRALFDLNALADVSDAVAAKRVALAAHRSQTERPDGRPDWPVLADLGGGDFVARLTAGCEMFKRYEANA